jgi:hypothetical protein
MIKKKAVDKKAAYSSQRQTARDTGDFKTQMSIYNKLKGKPTGNEAKDANNKEYARKKMGKKTQAGLGGHKGY